MPFQKPKKAPRFRDLITILAQSKGVDNALYQTVQEIINRLEQLVAVGQEAVDATPPPVVVSGGGGGGTTPPSSYSLDYLGDYVPGNTYNDGDIVVGPDGVIYVCTKDGITTPPDPWTPTGPPVGLHHLTHEPGGIDAMAVDAAPAVGSLRTLGSGANQAKPGNATSVPSAHASTHQPAGSDPLLNNAWLNIANIFTAKQTVSLPSFPNCVIEDTGQPANLRKFQLYQNAQQLIVQSVNDAETISNGVPLTMSRLGDVSIGMFLSVIGGQINFPSAQYPSASANCQDDYEEGTWTPTDRSGAGLALVGLSGSYVKVGQLVCACANLIFPANSSGAQIFIGGQPFVAQGTGAYWGSIINYTTQNALPFTLLILIGDVVTAVFSTNGGALVNSQFSGHQLRYTAIYRAST